MALTLAAAALGACGEDEKPGGGASTTASASKSKPQGEFLVVLDAERGSLRKEGGELSLTLEGVGKRVAAFSDRPRREAGTLTSALFLDTWKKEYGGDPPNAALGLPGGRPDADTVTLALDPPRREGSTVRFSAKPLTQTSPGLQPFRKRVDQSVPREFGAASLFIDGGGMMQIVAYGAQDVYLSGDPD
jgi:hypothetical protein